MDAAPSGRAPLQRRLPRGTSDYQAAWILDEDGDEDEYDDFTEAAADGVISQNGAASVAAPSVFDDGDDTMGDDGLGDEVGQNCTP